ncbi:MAG: hypothetical protein MUP85_07885 [Candidatus Lokiarchaeota archaeon]|nr:hypothetical protein [Candidatus Lokiarchaeota archaeon]
MVKIMVVAKYPPHKINEIVKHYMSSGKPIYPDYLKKLDNWVAQVTDDKFKTYAVYECPDDKIIGGLAALSKRFTYYASIKGYTFKVELLMEADEALKIMSAK